MKNYSMHKFRYIIREIIPNAVVRRRLSTKADKRCILFTFDDGPHPEITPRVLDALDKYEARAIFFIPSTRIVNAPKLIKEILDRNHEVGNHSSRHIPCNRLSFREIVNEINECKDSIYKNSGKTTYIFRPPMGIVTPSLLFASFICSHKIIKWSLDSGEYSYLKNATAISLAKNVLNKIHNNAIVLSHDNIETTPTYLKLVLPKLVDQGFNLKDGLISLNQGQPNS